MSEIELAELNKKKAEAFDLRVTLDHLTTQGNQLASIYTQMCNDILKKEEEMKKTEEAR